MHWPYGKRTKTAAERFDYTYDSEELQALAQRFGQLPGR